MLYEVITIGMYGELAEELDELEFLTLLKNTFNCGCIRHTELLGVITSYSIHYTKLYEETSASINR